MRQDTTEPLPVGTRVTFQSFGATTLSGTVINDNGNGIVWVMSGTRKMWKHRESLTVDAAPDTHECGGRILGVDPDGFGNIYFCVKCGSDRV